MQTVKRKYKQFLKDNFKGFQLRKPLFYCWNFGLRFNLQVGKTNTDEYFEEVTKRATTLFQSAFNNTDKVFMVFVDYKYKRRKIRYPNYTFRQIDGLEKTDIFYTKSKGLYEPGDKNDIRNIAIVELTAERINYRNILTAIGHSDFPPRQPRLDKNGIFTDKEIYFINIDKKLIFHMYDDRGLDIIASDKETLRPIYIKHNDLILDYDRSNIDKLFK
jgi:hypothetical protein